MRATIALVFFLACSLNAQSFQRYDFTFSGGASFPLGQYDTSVSLGATGGFRLTPSIELETGVFGVISPVGASCGAVGCTTVDSRYIWVPFGVRFILPLKQDRVELSAGAGGLYDNFSSASSMFSGPLSYHGFGGYLKTSVAVALDRHRHFWLGATPRVIVANGSGVNARDRWFMITGDIGFRF
jgi:hypothetical protein